MVRMVFGLGAAELFLCGGELLAQFGKTLDIEKSKDIILNDMRREIKVMTRF